MDDHNSRMVNDHIGRIGALEKEVQILKEWKAGIMIQHETLLEGVADFRDFQMDAREFFHRADERAKTEKDFHNQRDREIKNAIDERHVENKGRQDRLMLWVALLTLVVGIIAAGVAWMAYLDTKAKIEKGLLKLPKITLSDSIERVYAKSQQPPQNAGSSQPVHY